MTSALHHPAQAEAQARSARGLAQFDGTHHLPGQFFFRWSIFGLPWGAFCPVLCQGWRCSYGQALRLQLNHHRRVPVRRSLEQRPPHRSHRDLLLRSTQHILQHPKGRSQTLTT
ncbi:hypothetical protein Pyn_34766 [Prunus yedoensis var. nudiflora]|uniref:Uncharacterized protein n=1 Tax=Prunus yedoensis var. nudiflora TaxID=2094558 RepID=A0A314Z5I9_PRUYE|nr:hypothetical protein Pyn_34766 [Prunus yedoensis var. nudiflora]